jgi:hypothetical protein
VHPRIVGPSPRRNEEDDSDGSEAAPL